MSSMSSNDFRTVRADPGTRAGRKPRADGVESRRAILHAAANLATTRGLEGLSIGELVGVFAHRVGAAAVEPLPPVGGVRPRLRILL